MPVLLNRIALGAVLVLPLFLLHARGLAEAAIAVADLCFLAHAAQARDWSWLRPLWMRCALAWWGWLVVCSAPIPALRLGEAGWHGFGEALLLVRFLVLLAAMQHMILLAPRARRFLSWIVAASAAWIAIESLQQFATGRNLFGDPRGGDGELTGPFSKPRAGPPLSRLIFPVLVPPAAALLAHGGVLGQGAAVALLLAGVGVVVLIGQRMPALITGLGLLVCFVLLPRLRVAVLAVAVAAAALVAASVVVSPPTYYRLVEKFSAQMDRFSTSQYGELYARAWDIAMHQPVTGRGVEGFRTGCPLPQYFRPTFGGRIADGGGAVICQGVHHPHNFYFEALVEGGFPGLLLFSAAAVAWLAAIGRGLWRRPDPLRVGLFASIFIQLWPFASTSAFDSMPMGGWFFLLLGWALAEAATGPR